MDAEAFNQLPISIYCNTLSEAKRTDIGVKSACFVIANLFSANVFGESPSEAEQQAKIQERGVSDHLLAESDNTLVYTISKYFKDLAVKKYEPIISNVIGNDEDLIPTHFMTCLSRNIHMIIIPDPEHEQYVLQSDITLLTSKDIDPRQVWGALSKDLKTAAIEWTLRRHAADLMAWELRQTDEEFIYEELQEYASDVLIDIFVKGPDLHLEGLSKELSKISDMDKFPDEWRLALSSYRKDRT